MKTFRTNRVITTFVIMSIGLFCFAKSSYAVYPVAGLRKFLLPKFIFGIIAFFFGIIFTSPAYGADVYVATNGNDSTGNGTIGLPYQTIQAGINALKIQGPGNTLYLRGGTYTELPMASTVRGISYAALDDATSWDNAYKITSYPGEWAVIDASEYADERIFAFYTEASTSEAGMVGFIEFSRLEIKNVNGITHSAAIAGTGGPFNFRYLYLHNNDCPTSSNNPGAIRLGNGSGDITIEYCAFKDNMYSSESISAPQNNGHVVIFSDYRYEEGEWGFVALHNARGFSIARHNVTIRYNYFDGGAIGYKEKASQRLASNTTTGQPVDEHGWFSQGNDVHHNIFKNHTVNDMRLMSDFNQVHNNITDSSNTLVNGASISTSDTGSSSYRGAWKNVIYNNTVMGGEEGGYINIYDFPSGATTLYSQAWAFNNILDSPYDYDQHGDLSFNRRYNVEQEWDFNNLVSIKNNYFYRPRNANLVRIQTSYYDLESLNALQCADNNISHEYDAGDILYVGTSGASKYKLNPSYSDYPTVSSGGLGGNHPYLSGVTIPSYIGATNPDDNDWIDGVLDLATVSNLQNAPSGDPDWVEGSSEDPDDTTAPNAPSGLSVS